MVPPYSRQKVIGRGLFSVVYQSDTPLGGFSRVAVKVTIVDDERAPHKVDRELSILKRLRHDKIVRLLESFRGPSADDALETEVGIVMPLYGVSLNGLIASAKKAMFPSGWRNGLDPGTGVMIAAQLADALAYLHSQGVIHRDLKPDNILFPNPQSPHDLKLIDLGISWIDDGTELADAKITDVGTTVYRAPEVLFGVKTYGSSYDVWAYGCTVAKMFTRQATDLFGEPRGDLALLAEQFKVIGTPTVTSWPEMASNSTFTNMNFDLLEGIPLDDVVPRAPASIVDVLKGCLRFQSTDRLTANEILYLLDGLNAK